MNDMSSVIVPKSDQLNSDSLMAGPLTIRIRDVAIRPGTEQPVSIFYDGDENKPWKPCKSMSRVLVSVWGADAKEYVGKSVTLYRDGDVTWGGMKVGGIRVSHVSHIDKPIALALTATKGKKAIATIKPLAVQQPPADQGQRRQSPADWTGDYIAKVEAAPDQDALTSIEAKAEKTVASLKEKFPDLYKRISNAVAKKEASFEPAREGRADPDMGETFNDDPFDTETGEFTS